MHISDSLFCHPSDTLEMFFKSGVVFAFFSPRSIWMVLGQVLHAAAISLGISWCPLQLLHECLLVLASYRCSSIALFCGISSWPPSLRHLLIHFLKKIQSHNFPEYPHSECTCKNKCRGVCCAVTVSAFFLTWSCLGPINILECL